MIPSTDELLHRHRERIESALAYAGGSHTFDDVRDAVHAGTMQFWPGRSSVMITQVSAQPRTKALLFFLAAGNQQELEAMEPVVCEWGKAQGCRHAEFLGRRGWKRSFLPRRGWTDSRLAFMVKAL
jgi:hypothetical protein